jgi:LPS sulfotransferase NodH
MPTPCTTHLLICATHRTGSNLLEQYLRATGIAGKPREYYGEELALNLAQAKNLPDPDRAFLDYHRAILTKWTGGNGVFSAKIMWGHLDLLHTRVQAAPGGEACAGATPWQTVTKLHPAPKVIWMTRKDKVRQAISMVRAKQTGVFSTMHLDKGLKQAAAAAEYDFHLIRFYVEKFTMEDELWKRLFHEEKICPHRIENEEFIQNPKDATVAILTALGMPEPTTWHWPEIPIRRQSDATTEEWRARYHEEAASFKGGKDPHRERRHQARKVQEMQAARAARWSRWQQHAPGRILIHLEQWMRNVAHKPQA